MTELSEKVEALHHRLADLNDIFTHLIKSLSAEPHKLHHSSRNKGSARQPIWVGEIRKLLKDLANDVRKVKETLGRNSPSIGSVQTRSAVNTIMNPNSNITPASPEQVVAPTPEPFSRDDNVKQASGPRTSVRINLPDSSDPNAGDHMPRLSTLSISADTSTNTTQTALAVHDSPPGTGPTPIFHCDYRDIASLNEGKFKKFSSDSRVKEVGYYKLVVKNLPHLTIQEGSIGDPGKHHLTNLSCSQDSHGFVQIAKGRRQVRLPHLPFPQPQGPRSQEDLREFWDKTMKCPPSKMHYISGPPLFPDIELSPGKGLERVGGKDIPGVGTTYAYLSTGISLSICHNEDVEFRSLNILRAGATKYWLFIKPAYRKELELRLRQLFPRMGHCSQALRHLSRAIPLNKLDEWQIGYSLDYCIPGEAIVTEEGTLHQVGNGEGGNYALAINIVCDSTPAIPKDYQFCTKICDPHAITAADLTLNKSPLLQVQANRMAGQQVLKTCGMKRKALPVDPIIRKPRMTPQMGTLLDAVSGKHAFDRLRMLIYYWRDRSKAIFNITNRNNAGQLVQIINTMEARSTLTEFLIRFTKVKVADIIDGAKDGRLQADPIAIANLLTELKWDHTKANRAKLNNLLAEGRQWKRISGSFEGFLCIVPPNQKNSANLQPSGTEFRALSNQDLKFFHSIVKSSEDVQLMCRVGKAFQDSIWSGTEVPGFIWESNSPKDLSLLSIKELTPLMEKFHVIDENEFHATKYTWPKPDGWHWDWPQNPLSVHPSGRFCELCDRNSGDCNCITTCVPTDQPQITNEGGKGQGVRAIKSTYSEGQILGELCGEIVPLDSYQDTWAIEFVRPDLNDEPVAQIYTKERGNWARKVNHSHNPCAKFRVMKISGWWRQMLVAIRDIRYNDEITADCGRDFLRGTKCLCDVCEAL